MPPVPLCGCRACYACTTPLGSITPHPPGSDFAGHATEGASGVRERVKGVRFPNVPRRTHGFVFISACDSIGLTRFEVGPVERNPLNYAHASGVRLSRRHSGGRGAATALGAGSALAFALAFA